MSTAIQITKTETSAAIIERVMIGGELGALNDSQRVEYYRAVCDSIGLNPLTKPFDYIRLNGKLVLYALKAATDQIRTIHKVSIEIMSEGQVGDLYVVRAKATLPDGRTDSDLGSVSIAGKKGEDLANQMMKAATKAKRRVTLSICGLGLLDETEVADIPAKELGSVKPGVPEPGDGNTVPSAYRIPFGKYVQRTLEELYDTPGVGPAGIAGYINYLETAAKKKNVPITGVALEFITRASDFLGAMENSFDPNGPVMAQNGAGE